MNLEMYPLELIDLKSDIQAVLHTLRHLGCTRVDELSVSPETSARPFTLDRETIRLEEDQSSLVARSMLGRCYSVVGVSIMIDEATSAFEVEVESIINLVESELCLTRLANEIERTSRRLNALGHLVIPRLEAERDFIRLALDERERSDLFRLKRVKGVLEHRRGG